MNRKTGEVELHGHDGTAAEFVAALTPLVRLGELGKGRPERSKHAGNETVGNGKQATGGAGSGGSGADAADPVSYTHLDVYKRQE